MRASFCAAMVLLVSSGCGDSPLASRTAAYTFAFHETQAEVYTPSSTCGMYCTATTQSDRHFTGTLRIDGAQVTLEIEGQTFADAWPAPNAAIPDPITLELLATDSNCPRVLLQLHGGGSSGSFQHTHDCHGLDTRGTVARAN